MCENDIPLTKDQMRKKAKAELKNYFADRELALQCARTVADNFLRSREYSEAPMIFAYMAMPDEIDLSLIIKKAVEDGKTVCVPRMIPGTNDMRFHIIFSCSEKDFSKENKFAIMEPAEESEVVLPQNIPEKSVFLCPGLAFNLNGVRLGRGKGFYDKYLSQLPDNKEFVLCGVSTVNVITKAIPHDENDVKMNFLLNEYGFIRAAAE